MPDGFIPPHGGYKDLLSFRKARIIYDGTVLFCKRFLDKRDRTVDQMVQAARSGKQNILDGRKACSLKIKRKLLRIFDALLERNKKRGGFLPIHRAVIVAERKIHHRADDYLILDRDWSLLDRVDTQDSALGRIQDRSAK